MIDREYQVITVAQNAPNGPVATITLNVPERKNPLGPLMVNELLWALDDARDDDDVRVIVLTGAGKAFSAGGDLKQMGTGDAPALESKGDYADLLLRFTALGKPTVARIRGHAMGGGLGLVASCDFAVAGESAILGTPEVKLGLWPMMIMAVLRRVVPRRKLLSMMLLGEKLTANEALSFDLVGEVVPEDELDARVESLAEQLSKQSPTAMRAGLRAYHRMSDQALTEAVPELQNELFALLGTDDAREGMMAFFEKRPPVWTGK